MHLKIQIYSATLKRAGVSIKIQQEGERKSWENGTSIEISLCASGGASKVSQTVQHLPNKIK